MIQQARNIWMNCSFSKELFFGLICGLWCSIGIAQITPGFTTNVSTGCGPLTVNFQDVSTGTGIIYRKWDFGNGNVSVGNVINPSVIYVTPGSYDVLLTISDGVDTVQLHSQSRIIVATNPSPVIWVSALAGCVPMSLQVNEVSAPANTPIVSWEWQFKDGSIPDTLQNTSHVYSFGGSYAISLIVTDSLGCIGRDSLVQPVITDIPTASFLNLGVAQSCEPPLNVNLINTSNGVGTSSSIWNVGNQTYTTPQLAIAINVPGTYDLELITIDSIGCSDTLQVPDLFVVEDTTYTLSVPDTMCVNLAESFVCANTSAVDFNWMLGDGTVKNGSSVTHAYSVPGTYSVTLILTKSTGCMDTLLTIIEVEDVHSSFSLSISQSCALPINANYFDNSVGNITSWDWRFGAGSTSQGKNSFQKVNVLGAQIDSLIVTTNHGCSDTSSQATNYVLANVVTDFTSSKTQGCAPLGVTFNNTTNNPSNTIVNYQWEFYLGGAIIGTSKKSTPNFSFQTAGVYTVKLEGVLKNGCTSFKVDTIRVGSKQLANFQLDTNLTCASSLVSTINNSVDVNKIDHYHWNFGDGGYSFDFEPTHKFTDTGYVNVSLITGYNGCFDTAKVDSAIYVMGPVLNFSYVVNCDTPNLVSFTPRMLGGTGFSWNFGDGSPQDSSILNVTHLFPVSDSNYNVHFSGYDSGNGCGFTKMKIVKVRFIKGEIHLQDSNLCIQEPAVISTLGSENAIGSVLWSIDGFAGQVIDAKSKLFSFAQKGSHKVYGIVHDLHGCVDTVSQNVMVYSPIVNFQTSDTLGCSPVSASFSDYSVSDTNITGWAWDFGDGGVSSVQNPTHTYTNQRNNSYHVSLQVTDTFGCKNTFRYQARINLKQPVASFSVVNAAHCKGDSLEITGVNPSDSIYSWDFGDGTNALGLNPLKTYTSSGQYTVGLSVMDQFGCVDTNWVNNLVEVHEIPHVGFVANETSLNCYPSSVYFSIPIVNGSNHQWFWDFGDGSTSFASGNSVVHHSYDLPGDYSVGLKIKSGFGCADSLIRPSYIHVSGPTAQISPEEIKDCLSETFKFELIDKNANARLFTWDFGDGITLQNGNGNDPVYHKYNYGMKYNVTLIFSDSIGLCVKTDQVEVEAFEVKSMIEVSDTLGCAPLRVQLSNVSVGSTMGRWLIDKESNIISNSFNKDFLEAGLYDLSLIVWNDSLSCRDTSSTQVTVLESPNLRTTEDTLVCGGTQIDLNVSGATSYAWSPSWGVGNDTSSATVTQITESVLFQVVGVNEQGCETKDSVLITVIEEPFLSYFPNDTLIPQGTDLGIQVEGFNVSSFLWESNGYLSCSDCFDPVFMPEEETMYSLTYGDEYSCFEKDTSFTISLEEYRVFVPNAFTPDGDGVNDYFIPVTYGVDRLMYMYVYDSWGGLVFESTDLNIGWDGTVYGEPVPPNSLFVYKIKVVGLNSKTSEYVGSVQVMR
ncbi:MAG: gliding motility-associated-like protein [Salibacteraceae bacterium]|jgi:gliding motility-associated-like protein